MSRATHVNRMETGLGALIGLTVVFAVVHGAAFLLTGADELIKHEYALAAAIALIFITYALGWFIESGIPLIERKLGAW